MTLKDVEFRNSCFINTQEWRVAEQLNIPVLPCSLWAKHLSRHFVSRHFVMRYFLMNFV